MAFVVALFAAYFTMTITLFGGTSFTVLSKEELDAQVEAVHETTVELENKLDGTTTTTSTTTTTITTATLILESPLNVTDENYEAYINPGCRFLGFLIQVFL